MNQEKILSLLNNTNIDTAVEHLFKNDLVAFPTETVYGLGALAHDAHAIEKIYHAKGRPSHNPLIIHVADKAMAQHYALFNEVAHILADAFFPAALTLVLPAKREHSASAVRAGGDTVALRCPNHPVAQALLRKASCGIAAPSANRSGKISPTHAQHVREEFSHLPDNYLYILDGGATTLGIESTVVECLDEGVRILRQGSITEAALKKHVTVIAPSVTQKDALLCPGLLSSHYAPNATVRLNATSCYEGEGLIAFGTHVPSCKVTINLSEKGDVEEAAAHLYHALRTIDKSVKHIAVMPIPNEGVGVAINDRLRRAAYQNC